MLRHPTTSVLNIQETRYLLPEELRIRSEYRVRRHDHISGALSPPALSLLCPIRGGRVC